VQDARNAQHHEWLAETVCSMCILTKPSDAVIRDPLNLNPFGSSKINLAFNLLAPEFYI